MYNITIVAVGSIKEDFWKLAIKEYLKRLQPFAKITIREVPEEKIDSINNRKTIIKKEGIKLLKHILADTVIISLVRTGQQYSSTDLSAKLDEWSQFGKTMTFVIGGPLGLDDEVLDKSNSMLALSQLTFTHQMARVILLEQIYRGSKILQGGAYHY